MKTCVVIYNPNSGHSLVKKNLPEYKALIEKYGYSVTFIGTEYRGHAKEIVNHIGHVDLLMSMGGDGTFNEVVNGNLQRRKRLVLAHIPVGTTNDVGAMFGYGKDIKKNIKDCLSGEVIKMDIPLINGRPFVYVAGFGKFLQIPYETPRDLKKKIGHAAYIWMGIKDFFKPTKNYEIEYIVDGEKVEGFYSFILVSSASRIAGFNFYKDVKLNDDTFEVLFCTYTKRIDIIRSMAMLLTSDAAHVDGIEFYKAHELKVNFKKLPKKPWCVDGEKLELRNMKYVIKNEKDVEVLVPSKNLDKLFIK